MKYWVTNATMSFELEEGKNESLTPIRFLDTANRTANLVYVKKYTDSYIAVLDYRTAIINLDYCIEHYSKVASNTYPDGSARNSETAIQGLGSFTLITQRKKVLAHKINKV
ncbi:hypothetical protein AN643_01580 [Candidatus Epulonipiscioides saccharophilum]|nr:hypothetical protein AN643_01580 [Epulopiscium sp. SCG-B10WGA-EpuloB]